MSILKSSAGARETAALVDRSELLREINLTQESKPTGKRTVLVVVNIADTKKYDEIIRVFGYKFADDLLNIRLMDLDFIANRETTYRVGFWSIGLIFHARHQNDYDDFLEQLIEVLAQPVICRGIPVSIRAGVGICDLTKGLGAAEDLLQATYLAGQTGAEAPEGWAECNYELSDDHRRAFSLIAHAEHSLSTPYEFELSYQARVDIKTWKCQGAEALLRWRHPTLGMVMPDEFIPLIEMTGLIRQMTFWVLSRAIAQTAEWHAAGYVFRACVNISPKNLDEADFATRIAELLDQHALAPKFLELEFSERRSFANFEAARGRLQELRDMGISISIDDFGVGTNGFWSLENVPANIVKIDRRLIRSILDDPRQQALVRSMINMAHDLGMEVVAEGLENPETLKMLAAWDCDAAEGYLINRPMPAEAFLEWIGRKFIQE